MRPSQHTRGGAWSAENLPGAHEHLRAELVRRLEGRLSVDGALRDPCRSRVLETALAFPLLRGHPRYGERERAAEHHLREHHARAAPLERVLAEGALRNGTRLGGDLVEDVIARTPGFTSRRKRALIDAFGTVLGARPRLPWDEQAFALDGLHSWARVQTTAAKVLTAHASGRPDRITDEDVRVLLETRRGRDVWEGNILIFLCVLHALARLPRTGAVVEDGLRTLVRHQRDDGGFPFVTDTDNWSTATAGVALAAARAPRATLSRIETYLLRRQQPAGGWSYTDRAHQTDVDDTSVAVQFLHCTGPARNREAIAQGLRSIEAVARPDGGFPTYVVQAPSEASMTAAALDALSTDWDRHGRLMDDGLRYLASQQNADGTFPPDWSSSRLHTVFRVVLTAGRYPSDAPAHVRHMLRRCMRAVLTEQNEDGGFGQRVGDPSDVISTAYGLIALCRHPNPRPAAAAIKYLLAARDNDGGLSSPPDSIGPRPFLFTVPVLAEIFTLLALGHVAHRVAPAPGDRERTP
ncbi:prenyltransferase/squalene oxidase repeat-containing protein [Streptomyces sp. NPDC000134]|uniref:prenyltransferase/squalene oxidase repeat-containing protein n=1 Tax=Streptomyces sp. NPDC000134 TaxID=3364536 RepID=UPI0036BE7109